MSKPTSHPTKRKVHRDPSKPITDAELLFKIAHSDDHDSFTQLYQRHRHSAYNLARQITCDPEMANEALQVGMLKVWKSAKTFHASGNARGWILRIIAFQSISLVRSKHRRCLLHERLKLNGRSSIDTNPECVMEQMEQTEQSKQLEKQIQNLSVQQRRLISLHFLAGMSHGEIGNLLCIPRRTVSFKIQESLHCLRTNFKKAGLASLIPILMKDNLNALLSTCHSLPAHNSTWVNPVDHSNKPHSSSPQNRLIYKGLTIFAFAVILTLALTTIDAQTIAPLPRASSTRTQSTGSHVIKNHHQFIEPVPDNDINHYWNFSKGPSKDFQAIRGPWSWLRINETLAGMLTSATNRTTITLRFPLSPRPLVIQVQTGFVNPKERAHWGSGWLSKEKNSWPRKVGIKFYRKPQLFTTYLFNRYSVELINGKVAMVRKYHSPYPSKNIVLTFSNVMVFDVSLKTIPLAHIPERIRLIGDLQKVQKMTPAK